MSDGMLQEFLSYIIDTSDVSVEEPCRMGMDFMSGSGYRNYYISEFLSPIKLM